MLQAVSYLTMFRRESMMLSSHAREKGRLVEIQGWYQFVIVYRVLDFSFMA